MPYLHDLLPVALAAGAFLCADQLTKAWIEHRPPQYFPHRVGRSFRLQRVHNHGLMLHLLQSRPLLPRFIPLAVLLLFAVAALPELLALPQVGMRIAAGILFGSALGNVLDRFTRGYVVDWLIFPRLPGKKLPRLAFNLADLGIFAAVLRLIIGLLCQ